MPPNDFKSTLLRSIERLGLHPLFGPGARGTATVFMAHGFSTDGTPGTLTPDDLRRHFTFLRDGGYQVLTLDAYVDALLDGSARALRRSVVFTVDDGARDFYLHAFPVFREFGYPATLFLTTDYIDRRLFLWWHRVEHALGRTTRTRFDLSGLGLGVTRADTAEDRQALASPIITRLKQIPNAEKLEFIDRFVRDAGVDESHQPTGRYTPLSWDEIETMAPHGISFHPHTRSHPVLSRIGREETAAEVGESRAVLVERLGTPADIFCYPNGRWDDIDAETIEVLREAGYRAAVTAVPGFDRPGPDLHPFLLRRYSLPADSATFAQYVSGLEGLKERLRGRSPTPDWVRGEADAAGKAG